MDIYLKKQWITAEYFPFIVIYGKHIFMQAVKELGNHKVSYPSQINCDRRILKVMNKIINGNIIPHSSIHKTKYYSKIK